MANRIPMANGQKPKPRLHLIRHIALWSLPSGVETIAKAVAMGVGLAMLPKEEFGIISLSMLAFSYSGFLQVGASDALMLRLPDLYVKRDFAAMAVSILTVLRFTTRNVVLAAILSLIAIAVFGDDPRLTLAFSAYFASAILYQIYLHYLLANRYIYELRVAAQARALIAIGRGMVQVAAVITFGFYGFLAAEALIYLPPLLLLCMRGKVELDQGTDRKVLKDLIKRGVPIVAVGIAGAMALTLDRWFATSIGGLEGIAIYGAAAYVATLLAFIPGQARSFFSQYAREMLAHGRTRNELAAQFMVFSVLLASFWGGISLFVVDAGGWLIAHYLPKYATVLTLLPFVVLIALLRTVTANDMTLLIISDRSKHALFVNLFVITSIVALNGVFYVAFDSGLMGVVLATLGAVILQFLALSAIRKQANEFQPANFLLLSALLAISAFNLLFAHQVNVTHNFLTRAWMNLALHYAIAVALAVIALVWLWRRGDFSRFLAIARRQF